MVSPYLLIFFISISLIWLMFKRWRLRRILHLSERIGGSRPALPLIGHAYMFIRGSEGRMTAFKTFGLEATKQNGMTSLWLGYDYYTVITDPEIAEAVMKTCLEKGYFMSVFSHLLGNGSVIAPVNIWRPRRKVVAPNFSLKNLQSFVKIFSQQSEIMAERLVSVADKDAFSIWKYFTTYSMDSVCETALGIKVGAQGLPHTPFLAAFEEYCQLTAARMCQPWLWLRPLYRLLPQYTKLEKHRKFIWNYIDKIIKLKRNQKLKQSSNGFLGDNKSLLDMLLEASGSGSGFSDIELREETLVIVLAGTDTSAVGAAFTAVMLSVYPEIQGRVLEELYAVFGDSERPVSAEDLPKLKYLEAVVKESMRLYPPVAVIGRKLDKDIILPSGITLVKDSGAMINMWAMHRDPRHWGLDADQFRPERFLSTPSLRHAAYMPFSYGPRNCIGYQYGMMSMKTVLATVVRRYRLLPAAAAEAATIAAHQQRSPRQHHPLRVKYDIMMRDVGNYMVRLEPRSKSTD